MKRLLLYALLSALYALLPPLARAQTVHNLEIIWQCPSPDIGGGPRYWGYKMAGGDINGDGFSDFLSATDTTLGIGTDRVRAHIYIYFGGTTLNTTPSQIIIYDSLSRYPTLCIADFNSDGFGDLAVGDFIGTGVNYNNGCVYIHYGTRDGLNNMPNAILRGDGGGFGNAITYGDINGDGIDDLIVGAHSYTINGNRNGRVYIYYGDTLGVHTMPAIILNGHLEAGYAEHFGRYIDGTIDFNKDGYHDLIVGAYLNCTREIAAGKVYYFLSKNAPIDTIPDGWIYGEGYEHWLGGFNVSSINTDTIYQLPMGWFGTPIWPSTTGMFGSGKCYLTHGDTTGELVPSWAITGDDTGLGFYTASAGYADGDKLGDMLSGAAPAYDGRGKVYLWLRRPIMSQLLDAFIIGRFADSIGESPGDAIGARIALVGDVNGDERDEYLISNYYTLDSNMIWLCKYTGPNAVEGAPATSVERPAYRLKQNYPNPFSQTTSFDFQLAKTEPMSLRIYNIAGQLVRTMVEGEQLAGTHHCQWDGSDEQGKRVAAGKYIYKLKAGGREYKRAMTIIK